MYQINHACHFEILFRGETLKNDYFLTVLIEIWKSKA